jgi:N-acetylmuramoyl-L-alanine amidase
MGIVLAGCLGVALSAWPAQAAKLQSWRFDVNNRRLEFTTNETITPRVQLIPNPVRLVVDLPGVQNQPPVLQSYGQGVRSLRVGQFDRQTARIVLELEPGYTVDPEQVKVESVSALVWRINLPTPQFSNELIPPDAPPTQISAPPSSAPTLSAPPSASVSQPAALVSNNVMDDVLVTPSGLFLKTQRGVNDVQLRRSSDRRVINIELPGVTAARAITRNTFRMDYHGIQRVSVNQITTSPPLTRVTLRVSRRSADWSATANQVAGVQLTPQSRSSSEQNEKQPPNSISLATGGGANNAANLPPFSPSPSNRPRPGSFSSSTQPAIIQAVNLGGSQLLIRTDRSLFFTTGWEGSSYRITLLNSQLAPRLREPAVGVGSALSQIQFQEDGRNIKILFTPAQGIRFAGVTRLDSQTLVANLLRPGQTAATPIRIPQTTRRPPPSPVRLGAKLLLLIQAMVAPILGRSALAAFEK